MWLSKIGNLGVDFIINVASNIFLILTMQIKSTGIRDPEEQGSIHSFPRKALSVRVWKVIHGAAGKE